MKKKIRCNNQVIILNGTYKGKIGKINKIISKNYAIVEGINLKFKHQKPIPALNIAGGIIKKEAPIHLSNLAFLKSKK